MIFSALQLEIEILLLYTKSEKLFRVGYEFNLIVSISALHHVLCFEKNSKDINCRVKILRILKVVNPEEKKIWD